MKHPACLIADFYRKQKIISQEDIDKMEYTLKTLFNEWSKFLSYLLVFMIVGEAIRYIICYLTFVSIRLFAGGIHCRSYWGCFFASFLFLSACVFLPDVFGDNYIVYLCLAFLSCLFPMLLSPVTPTFRVIQKQKNRVYLRLLAIAISLFWCFVSFWLIGYKNVSQSILCSISIANYQLIFPEILMNRKEAKK